MPVLNKKMLVYKPCQYLSRLYQAPASLSGLLPNSYPSCAKALFLSAYPFLYGGYFPTWLLSWKAFPTQWGEELRASIQSEIDSCWRDMNMQIERVFAVQCQAGERKPYEIREGQIGYEGFTRPTSNHKFYQLFQRSTFFPVVFLLGAYFGKGTRLVLVSFHSWADGRLSLENRLPWVSRLSVTPGVWIFCLKHGLGQTTVGNSETISKYIKSLWLLFHA